MISLVIDHDRIHAAIITDGGDFVSAKSIEAPVGGYRDWLVACRDLVTDIGAPASMAVAVAVPAIMDGDRATFSAVAPLSDSDLRRDLQSTLGRVVRCFGFGDCLAAWQTKTLEDAGTVMALWVGASCHGGVRANGRPLTGAHGAAGNWAHLQLPSPVPHELDGRPCWCGRSGCLETFLSTSGLEEDYERVTGEHHSASDIAAAAAEYRRRRHPVYEDRLGRATATMITLLDPNVIILGGAVLLADRMWAVAGKWPGYVQIDRSKTELLAVQGHRRLAWRQGPRR